MLVCQILKALIDWHSQLPVTLSLTFFASSSAFDAGRKEPLHSWQPD